MTPEERARRVDDTLMENYEPTEIDFEEMRALIAREIGQAEQAVFTETLEGVAQYLEEAMNDVAGRGHAPLDKVLCIEDVRRLAQELRGYKKH